MAFCTPIVVKDEPVFVCDREVDTALYTNSGNFDTDRKCAGREGIFGGSRPYVRGSHNSGDRNHQEQILLTKMVVLVHVDTVKVAFIR